MMSLSRRTRSLAPRAVKSLWKARRDPEYRSARERDTELDRLAQLPRDEPGTTTLLGASFAFLDARAFCDLYRSIFQREIYRFEARAEAPLVLDCGANVGLATRYWKQFLPATRVVAFEPDTAAAERFVKNMQLAGITDVELRREAVWTHDGHVSFGSAVVDRGRVAGRVVEASAQLDGSLEQVACVRLRDLLVEPVELLKLDIEGAEVDVIEDCAERLHLVERVFVEYHGFAGRKQRLAEMLAVLEGAGFRCYVEHEGQEARQPFVSVPTMLGMDLQLNVFCMRSTE